VRRDDAIIHERVVPTETLTRRAQFAIPDDWSHWNISISLRVCEPPHIVREAFVVEYPRGQDQFRHANWRTGDAHRLG
jgi:hypothetical protein